jgi:hypothetical protein
MSESLKKITPKTLGYDKKAIVSLLEKVADGESVPLYKVAGSVTGMTAGTSTYGDWLKFKGEFSVILADGRAFDSNSALFPAFLTDRLAPVVKGANGDAVEFAFSIFAKRRDDLAIGYEYTARSLVDVAPTDTAKRLQGFLQLAAPAPVPAPAPAPGPAPEAPPEAGQVKKKGK